MANTEYKTIEEVLGDFNPVEELIKLFDKTDDVSLRIEICVTLLKYIYPLMQEE